MKFTFSSLTILLALLWNLPAFGNTRFMNYCKYAIEWHKDEVSWLKYILKAETCDELSQKISQLKSYNEFLVPQEKIRTLKVASWTYEFPELIGIKSKYNLDDVDRILGKNVDRRFFFRELDGFLDFKNLKILDFTVYKPKAKFCFAWNQLKYQVKTVVIDWSNLADANECKYSSAYTTPDFIIAGDFIGSGNEKFAENIIGFESFMGRTRSLIQYPSLRYVGVNVRNSEEVGALVLNQNITHLALNSANVIEDIADVSELQNLAYLGLTCVKNELEFYGDFNLAPLACDKPYLKNLAFLKNLTWLRSLNISYSGLENVDELTELKQLKSLNISHNNIKEIPDFSLLTNLLELKTNNNPGSK